MLSEKNNISEQGFSETFSLLDINKSKSDKIKKKGTFTK